MGGDRPGAAVHQPRLQVILQVAADFGQMVHRRDAQDVYKRQVMKHSSQRA